MPLASTSLPIAGFWVGCSCVAGCCVLVIPLSPPDARRCVVASWFGRGAARSAVVAEDEVGHAARLGLPLDLVRQSPDHLGAALELLDLGDLDVHPDPAADGERRGEADL